MSHLAQEPQHSISVVSVHLEATLIRGQFLVDLKGGGEGIDPEGMVKSEEQQKGDVLSMRQ